MIVDHITKTFNEYWNILLLLFFSMLFLTVLMSRTAKLVEDLIGHYINLIFHEIGFSFCYLGIFIITGCFLLPYNITDGLLFGMTNSLLIQLFIFDISKEKYENKELSKVFLNDYIIVSNIVASGISGGSFGFILSTFINLLAFSAGLRNFTKSSFSIIINIIKFLIYAAILIAFNDYFERIFLTIKYEIDYLSFSKIVAIIICYIVTVWFMNDYTPIDFTDIKGNDKIENYYVITIFSLLNGLIIGIIVYTSIYIISSIDLLGLIILIIFIYPVAILVFGIYAISTFIIFWLTKLNFKLLDKLLYLLYPILKLTIILPYHRKNLCENCYHFSQPLKSNYKQGIRHCEYCDGVIGRNLVVVKKVIGLIGKEIDKRLENENYYINLWDENNSLAKFAQINELQIWENEDIKNYDLAINAVYLKLVNDVNQPRNWLKKIPVVIRGNPKLSDNIMNLLKREFKEIKLLNI